MKKDIFVVKDVLTIKDFLTIKKFEFLKKIQYIEEERKRLEPSSCLSNLQESRLLEYRGRVRFIDSKLSLYSS